MAATRDGRRLSTLMRRIHAFAFIYGQYAVRFAEFLTKVALSKAKMVRLIMYVHPPPSASLYDRWSLLQHPSEYWIRSWIPSQRQQQQQQQQQQQ